ncbi:Helicase POLQ-like [Schistosoma japonicum]|nr:Helicase POLQ-like [Schistosoma japonicum]
MGIYLIMRLAKGRKSSTLINNFRSVEDPKFLNKSNTLVEQTTLSPSDCAKNKQTSENYFGLPLRVKELFRELRGVTKLYDWQLECLNLTTVANGANLVYSLPTSGGKTLVAEILMLKELLVREKNVLFILPFVSIVQEKVRSLTSMGLELGFWVEEYAGNRGRIPPVKRKGSYSVLIATIEKAHTIVNSLIDTKSLDSLGLVIVDELHMIGDGGPRGACLEMILTKIRLSSPTTRIIGMSATLANISDLTDYLSAELYVSNFRPVKLVEYVKVGDHLYEITSSEISHFASGRNDFIDKLAHCRMVDFQYTKKMLSRDPDHLVALVAETLLGHSMNDYCSNRLFHPSFTRSSKERFSCLVFCPTKVHCENTAKMLAELLPVAACFPHSSDENYIAEKNTVDQRSLLLENLRLDNAVGNNGLKEELQACCPVLEYTVPKGIAYHHSGLTQEERNALETAYTEGVIRVLCCTSTLAAGVNLPARRVIIRKPYIGSSFLSGTQYQQMVGRAGRAGLDTVGESITILQPNERQMFAQMLSSIPKLLSDPKNTEPRNHTVGICSSSLSYENGKGLRQLILSLIGLELAVTYPDILWSCEKTLLAVQCRLYQRGNFDDLVRAALNTLIKMNLIVVVSVDAYLDKITPVSENIELGNARFQATKLGRASIKGGIDTDHIGPLVSDLRIAARAVNTSGPLHLLYLVAPPEIADTIQIDWRLLFDRISLMPQNEANLINLLGFPEGYVLWKATGYPIKRKLDERPLRRLYIALALSELWQNRSTFPIWYVAERYKFSRGTLQSMLTSAASLANSLAHAMASEFSTDSELWAFAHLLPEFATRLAYCVSSELLPLMELPGVKRARARQLYSLGYCTLKDIACANASDLTSRMAPFMSNRVAKEIIQAAQMLISERADALFQEANEMMSGVGTKSLLSQMADYLKFKPSSPKLCSSISSSNVMFGSFTAAIVDDEDLFS